MRLRTEIEFKHAERQQYVLGEGEHGQERSAEGVRIETHRTLVHHNPEHQADAKEPDATDHQKQPQREAPMLVEPSRPCMAPGKPGKKQDQQRIDADRDML